MAFASAEAGASVVTTSISMPTSKAVQVARTASLNGPTSAVDASLLGVPRYQHWTGPFPLARMPPPHGLLATRSSIAERNVSPTEEVVSTPSEFWMFRKQRMLACLYEQSIARGPIAEEAVRAAAAEIPATSMALPPTTVPKKSIPSWVQPAAYKRWTGDQENGKHFGRFGWLD